MFSVSFSVFFLFFFYFYFFYFSLFSALIRKKRLVLFKPRPCLKYAHLRNFEPKNGMYFKIFYKTVFLVS